MDYLNQIDYGFVEEMAKEFSRLYYNKASFSVNNMKGVWYIEFYDSGNRVGFVTFSAFDVSTKPKDHGERASTILRKAMYKKFGEEYLKDYKACKKKIFFLEHRYKLYDLKQEIEEIKNEKCKERV